MVCAIFLHDNKFSKRKQSVLIISYQGAQDPGQRDSRYSHIYLANLGPNMLDPRIDYYVFLTETNLLSRATCSLDERRDVRTNVRGRVGVPPDCASTITTGLARTKIGSDKSAEILGKLTNNKAFQKAIEILKKNPPPSIQTQLCQHQDGFNFLRVF